MDPQNPNIRKVSVNIQRLQLSGSSEEAQVTKKRGRQRKNIPEQTIKPSPTLTRRKTRNLVSESKVIKKKGRPEGSLKPSPITRNTTTSSLLVIKRRSKRNSLPVDMEKVLGQTPKRKKGMNPAKEGRKSLLEVERKRLKNSKEAEAKRKRLKNSEDAKRKRVKNSEDAKRKRVKNSEDAKRKRVKNSQEAKSQDTVNSNTMEIDKDGCRQCSELKQKIKNLQSKLTKAEALINV